MPRNLGLAAGHYWVKPGYITVVEVSLCLTKKRASIFE